MDKITHKAFKEEQLNLLLRKTPPLSLPLVSRGEQAAVRQNSRGPGVQRLFCCIRATVAVGTILIELHTLDSLRKTGRLKQS